MRARGMLLVFALTLFCSAGLLFLLEPMVGKAVLPRLGGSPAVWNSCVAFFQAVLLAGYAYAHLGAALLPARRQALVHLALLAACLLVLLATGLLLHEPPAASTGSPVLGLLLCLAASYGLPLFVVCASAPLLQKWFSASDHPAAADPYFLYGASNLGSMLALLAYPTLVEPLLTLQQQRSLWITGFVLLLLLCLACAGFLWRCPKPSPGKEDAEEKGDEKSGRETVGVWRRLRWLGLSFVPSSLMLGVTTYITTDLAAFPLLWVLPLGLYLLSFILVFSHLPNGVHRCMVMLAPPLVLTVLVLFLADINPGGLVVTIGTHLLTLFVLCMVCHGELAQDRPPPSYLTGYYLWISVGGVLGGLFNSLLAPVLFSSLAEYPLVLAAACLLLPEQRLLSSRWQLPRDRALAGCLLVALVAALLWRNHASGEPLLSPGQLLDRCRPWTIAAALLLPLGVVHVLRARTDRRMAWLDLLLPLTLGLLVLRMTWGVDGEQLEERDLLLLYGVPALACYAFIERPVRFGLGVSFFMLAAMTATDAADDALFHGRSFFGVLIVGERARDYDGEKLAYRYLIHGSTPHGRQFLRPDLRDVPTTYYDRTGPVGQLFISCNTDFRRNVGVIGLGTGTLACYALPGQRMTFYDIDPLIRDLAVGDNATFTFVNDACSRGAEIDVVLGDARVEMARRPAQEDGYGILVVDAFSSDAIPVHLITREALQLYLEHLADDGILAFHITNRHADLEPVLANLADNLGLVGRFQLDEGGDLPSKMRTRWVLLARKAEPFRCLKEPRRWRPLQVAPAVGVWTDDYCNVLSVLRW